jgi:ATP-GRASP peptide maturase of grasp-with-spasm system
MKTVLILSSEDDHSTDNVIKWINYFDRHVHVIRLHPVDIYQYSNLVSTDIEAPLVLELSNQRRISTKDISVIWYRKWHVALSNPQKKDKSFDNVLSVNSNLINEFNAFFHFFLYKIEQNNTVYWLNRINTVSPNKLKQLLIAKKNGLNIPHTFLSNQLSQKDFNKKMITKNMSDCLTLFDSKDVYSTLTSKVHIRDKDKSFFISLFQEEIQKELELRIFYLSGQCHAIAILSQNNQKTKVDYRNYDYVNPIREEYYQLPEKIIEKVRLFMTEMNLQTGSLDFILTKENEYIFLEVNPSGQYDIFNSCNIYPDKLIAQHLIEKYYEY